MHWLLSPCPAAHVLASPIALPAQLPPPLSARRGGVHMRLASPSSLPTAAVGPGRTARPMQLKSKLLERGHELQDVRALLDRLAAVGLQSDTEFAETFARSKWRQSKWGARRIEMVRGAASASGDMVLRVPACPPACLPARLPACPPACLPARLPACPLTCAWLGRL